MNVNSASVWLGNGAGTLQTQMDASIWGNNFNRVVDAFNREGDWDMAISITNSLGTVGVPHDSLGLPEASNLRHNS